MANRLPHDERPAEEYLSGERLRTVLESELQIVDAVVTARSTRISWNKVGEILGTLAQVAQQRYGGVVEQV